MKNTRIFVLTTLAASAAILAVPAVKVLQLRGAVADLSAEATSYAGTYEKVLELGGEFSEAELHEIAVEERSRSAHSGLRSVETGHAEGDLLAA